MKRIIFTTLLLLNLSHADEIERIESIVGDITELKKDYKLTEKEKQNYLKELKASQIENANLKSDLELYSDFTKKEESYKNRIKNLETQLNSLKKELKTKELQIDTKEIVVAKCLNSQREETNSFPKLQMKEEYQETQDSEIRYFKASAFRLKKQATIYDAVNGQNVAEWEDARSFTSNQRTDNWIKITGYFVNKQWQPASKEMWIEAGDVMIRKSVEQ